MANPYDPEDWQYNIPMAPKLEDKLKTSPMSEINTAPLNMNNGGSTNLAPQYPQPNIPSPMSYQDGYDVSGQQHGTMSVPSTAPALSTYQYTPNQAPDIANVPNWQYEMEGNPGATPKSPAAISGYGKLQSAGPPNISTNKPEFHQVPDWQYEMEGGNPVLQSGLGKIQAAGPPNTSTLLPEFHQVPDWQTEVEGSNTVLDSGLAKFQAAGPPNISTNQPEFHQTPDWETSMEGGDALYQSGYGKITGQYAPNVPQHGWLKGTEGQTPDWETDVEVTPEMQVTPKVPEIFTPEMDVLGQYYGTASLPGTEGITQLGGPQGMKEQWQKDASKIQQIGLKPTKELSHGELVTIKDTIRKYRDTGMTDAQLSAMFGSTIMERFGFKKKGTGVDETHPDEVVQFQQTPDWETSTEVTAEGGNTKKGVGEWHKYASGDDFEHSGAFGIDPTQTVTPDPSQKATGVVDKDDPTKPVIALDQDLAAKQGKGEFYKYGPSGLEMEDWDTILTDSGIPIPWTNLNDPNARFAWEGNPSQGLPGIMELANSGMLGDPAQLEAAGIPQDSINLQLEGVASQIRGMWNQMALNPRIASMGMNQRVALVADSLRQFGLNDNGVRAVLKGALPNFAGMLHESWDAKPNPRDNPAFIQKDENGEVVIEQKEDGTWAPKLTVEGENAVANKGENIVTAGDTIGPNGTGPVAEFHVKDTADYLTNLQNVMQADLTSPAGRQGMIEAISQPLVVPPGYTWDRDKRQLTFTQTGGEFDMSLVEQQTDTFDKATKTLKRLPPDQEAMLESALNLRTTARTHYEGARATDYSLPRITGEETRTSMSHAQQLEMEKLEQQKMILQEPAIVAAKQSANGYTTALSSALAGADANNWQGVETALNVPLPAPPPGIAWDRDSGTFVQTGAYQGREIDAATQQWKASVAPAYKQRDRAEATLQQARMLKIQRESVAEEKRVADEMLNEAMMKADVTTAEEAIVRQQQAETDAILQKTKQDNLQMLFGLLQSPVQLGMAKKYGLLGQVETALGFTMPEVPTVDTAAGTPNYNQWIGFDTETQAMHIANAVENGQSPEAFMNMIKGTQPADQYVTSYSVYGQ